MRAMLRARSRERAGSASGTRLVDVVTVSLRSLVLLQRLHLIGQLKLRSMREVLNVIPQVSGGREGLTVDLGLTACQGRNCEQAPTAHPAGRSNEARQ